MPLATDKTARIRVLRARCELADETLRHAAYINSQARYLAMTGRAGARRVTLPHLPPGRCTLRRGRVLTVNHGRVTGNTAAHLDRLASKVRSAGPCVGDLIAFAYRVCVSSRALQ